MGGSHFREMGFTGGGHEKGGSQEGSRKGGFTGGFTKRGVHVNPVNPPGYTGLMSVGNYLMVTGHHVRTMLVGLPRSVVTRSCIVSQRSTDQ